MCGSAVWQRNNDTGVETKMISTPVFSLIKYERKVGVKKVKNSGIRKVKRIRVSVSLKTQKINFIYLGGISLC